MDMCAFNKKPEDEADGNRFYKKRTAIVTRRYAEVRKKLEKTCPGTSESHQHVRAIGKATKIDRSTESGVYSKEFAKAICEAALSIHKTLKGASGNAETTPTEEGGVGAYCGCIGSNEVRQEEGLPKNPQEKGSPKFEDRTSEKLQIEAKQSSTANGVPNASASGAPAIVERSEVENEEEESGKQQKEEEGQHRVKNERSAHTIEWIQIMKRAAEEMEMLQIAIQEEEELEEAPKIRSMIRKPMKKVELSVQVCK